MAIAKPKLTVAGPNTNGQFGIYPNTNFRMNPIAQEVQDIFNGIYAQVKSFVNNPDSAINGMIVSGDAGTGKTYKVKKALRDTGHQKNTEYINCLLYTSDAADE